MKFIQVNIVCVTCWTLWSAICPSGAEKLQRNMRRHAMETDLSGRRQVVGHLGSDKLQNSGNLIFFNQVNIDANS